MLEINSSRSKDQSHQNPRSGEDEIQHVFAENEGVKVVNKPNSKLTNQGNDPVSMTQSTGVNIGVVQFKQGDGKQATQVERDSSQGNACNVQSIQQQFTTQRNKFPDTIDAFKHVQDGDTSGRGLQEKGSGDGLNFRNRTQNNFPRVSNNFERFVANKQGKNQTVITDNVKQSKEGGSSDPEPKSNGAKESAPAPYTVVQMLAAKLRNNQEKNEVNIELNDPKITTKQGMPAVIFDKDDFMVKLAATCKYTLVGEFTNNMPKLEVLRKSFTLQTQLSGGVKITHFNARHVYIDLDNELDYIIVWTKQRMSIEGQLMRIQMWTPTFKPEEETPIVPSLGYIARTSMALL